MTNNTIGGKSDYSAGIALLQQQVTQLNACCEQMKPIIASFKSPYATNLPLNSSPFWGDYHYINLYNESLLVSKIILYSVIRQGVTPQRQFQLVRNGVVLGYIYIPNVDLDTQNSRLTFTLNSVKLQFGSGLGSQVSWVNDPSIAYFSVETDYSKQGVITI